LENLGIEPYGARFDLDGRTVQIRGDSRTPLVGAFQAFHRAALEDYRARQPEPRPGWFSRLRSWIGRILGPRPSEAVREIAAAPPPARIAPVPAEPRPGAELPRHVPAADARPVAARAEDPVLRAVFADKEGVHLIWQPEPGKSKGRAVALTCSLDSQLAQRLQDCYSHLAELGYKVAGLELLRPEASAAAGPARVPDPAAQPAVAAAIQPLESRAAEAPARQRAPRQPRPAPSKAGETAAPAPLPEPGV
jgi:hypothetical protein